MKSERIEIEEPKAFQPFKLVINVESESDAAYLWSIFNTSVVTVKQESSNRLIAEKIKIESNLSVQKH